MPSSTASAHVPAWPPNSAADRRARLALGRAPQEFEQFSGKALGFFEVRHVTCARNDPLHGARDFAQHLVSDAIKVRVLELAQQHESGEGECFEQLAGGRLGALL